MCELHNLVSQNAMTQLVTSPILSRLF